MVERIIMRDRNRIDYNKKFESSKPAFNSFEEEKNIEEPIETVTEELVAEEVEAGTKPQEGKVVVKKNQSLNLREGMDTDAPVIKTLSNDEKVIIDTIYPDWYRVVTESGAEGYVMAQYIEMI